MCSKSFSVCAMFTIDVILYRSHGNCIVRISTTFNGNTVNDVGVATEKMIGQTFLQ